MQVNPNGGAPTWEEEDVCLDCANQEICPMVQMLATKLASLNEDTQVTGCEMFKERRRRFGLIDGGR